MNFAEKVREVVRTIPKGSVMTYGEVAKCAGNEKAARAVGKIMNQNYNNEIPCHRVVGKKTLGGYNRGVEEKKKRLQEEGAEIKNRL